MAILTFKSERQIQLDALTVLISKLGLNDVNAGSVLDLLTQAMAQEDFAQYYQMAQITRLVNLDAITGDDLDNKAFEYGLERQAAVKATGRIDILRAASFEKVSTTFYAGSPAPIVGDLTIDVNDASNVLIGTSGTLILGRGTANEEEVTYSAAPVNNTNFFRFTLDAALTENHAIEETVILKQGSDETILAGTVVLVPATGVSDEIQFILEEDAILLAGEDRVSNVPVIAQVAGTDGNIPVKAIEGTGAFSSPPFSGARAENTSKFTTGRDRQTDDELRDAIRNHVQSLSRGVKEAILNAIVGLVDPVSAKRVVSANVVLPQDTNTPVKIYIDDGTGFEPSFLSQGFEQVLNSATGGETRLQLDIKPLVKAQIENNIDEVYDLSSGALTLIYQVGNVSETITFNPADFPFAESATAEQVVTAINDKATLIEARTSAVGTRIVITAKADTNEEIVVTGGTANAILSFPTDEKETLFLYVNDEKKSKDGETAILDSQNSAPYDLASIGAYPHTLTIVVDGKTANTQTATINAVDVADTAAVTVPEIVAVLNRDLAGVTASGILTNTKVRLVSNTELSESSKLQVTGGTLNDATDGLNFITTEVTGQDGEYTLNRELGTIEFTSPLTANDEVTVGSLFTRAKLRAASSELYAPGTGQTLVISVDGGADQTITFDGTFAAGVTAEGTATFINNQLSGATATAREIGGLNYVEIASNTYEEATGTLEIKSTSTANAAFNFTLDTEVASARPHKAFKVSSNAGPFEFAEGDTLVVIVDNDSIKNTFPILMDYDGTATSGASTTVFADSSFLNVFTSNDELNDFYIAFKTGANTDTGTISTIADQGGNIFRYTFDTAPTNIANFAAGDIVTFEDLDDASNNGNFLITNVTGTYVEVSNPSGVNASLQSGTVTVGQRRQITDYVTATGTITVGSAFTNTPLAGETFIVIPSTVDNLVDFIRNTKVTSYSLKGLVEGVENNTKLQLSSKSNGSDGYIQITGGKANDKLGFNTDIFRGLQAYQYYNGLLELVHKTIYGDDQDLVSFPGIGAAGVQFQVLAPTVREIEVNIDVTLREGISISSLENEIKSAISGYINGQGVGDDIIIEEIKCAVLAIAGIIDVSLNTPTANIAIADNEIGRIRDALILIG